MNEKEFLKEVKEIDLMSQALTVLDWDIQTGMPEKSSEERSEVNSYLYGLYFSKKSDRKSQKQSNTSLRTLTNCLNLEKRFLRKSKKTMN